MSKVADQRFALAYTTLPTQQRRMRHVRSIAARNVHTGGGVDITELKLYFTLHSSLSNQAFYTSDVIKGSMNPTWKTFNLEHLALEDINTSKTSLVVRVWSEKDNAHRLVLEWTVCLSGLVYFGDKLQSEVTFATNTLVFGMFGGFYVAPKQQNEPICIGLQDCVLSVDQSLIRKSYSVMATDRIQTIQRAIKQTEMSGRNVRRNIEEAFSHTKVAHQRRAAREMVAMHVAMLQNELEWRTDKLRGEKEKYETVQTQNIQKERKLQAKFDTLRNDRARLREKKKSYFDVRERLIKTGALLVMRRKQLISELTWIYPMVENPHDDFTVLGVILPNAEKLQGHNEMQLEVALGYTCHLVLMISEFLDVPLRYPIDHRGSKSIIYDLILDKLSDREREFPLYCKGKEKFQFDYGVYLLNKNIAQLRYYCGMGTSDLRVTLANLQSLLQLRLGVKFGHMQSVRHAHPQSNSSTMTSQRQKPTSSQKQSTSRTSQKTSHSKQDELINNLPQNGARNRENTLYLEGSLDSSLAQDFTDSHVQKPMDIRLDNNSDVFKGSPDSFFEMKFEAEEGQSSNVPQEYVPFPRFDKLSNEHVTPESNTTHSDIRQQLDVDYDVNSLSSVSNQRQLYTQNRIAPITTLEQSLTTLGHLTKEKLLGPIMNSEDIEVVSSSEDSVSAVYGQQFKFMRDRTTFQSLPSDNLVINEDSQSQFNDNSTEVNVQTDNAINEVENRVNSESANDGNTQVYGEGNRENVQSYKIDNNSLQNESCTTPDSSVSYPQFNLSENTHIDSLRKSSAPIDTRPCFAQQNSDDSYMDSSPTFSVQKTEAS